VFLLQALGQRRWQYTDNPVESPVLIPDLELAILQEFTPDQELILNPGDMLYLPPGIAHHGVALERCMTFSIGFRAPTAAAALESFALETGNLGISNKRYGDADLELDRHSSEITDREIEKFKSLILDLFDQPQSLWNDCVGKLLSDSAVTTPEENEQPVYISDLQACAWLRHPETRMLYHLGDNALRLYCNGRAYDLPADQQIIDCVQQLCEQREWSLQLMHRCIALEPMQTLLVELASSGAILPFDE
jgi:50S ribosomal protein L16 3-hydroxylase